MYLRIWMNNDQLNGSLIGIQLEKPISVNYIVNGEPKQDPYLRSTSCEQVFNWRGQYLQMVTPQVISDYFVVLKYFTTNTILSALEQLITYCTFHKMTF